MKILFKIWKFPGASETFILSQIAFAIEAGFAVKVLIKDQPKVLENNIHENFIKKYNIRERIIFENLEIPKNKIYRIVKAFWLLMLNVKYSHQIFLYFKNKNFRDLNNIFQFHYYKKFKDFDIIHIQYGTSSKPLDLLKKVGLIRSKLVVSFHGHDLYFPLNGRLQNDGYYQDLFVSADYLVCNTPFLKSKLLELGPPQEKIRIVPVAVDTTFFKVNKQKQSRKKIRLVSVGRLDELKGQKYGIEAVKRLVEKGYDVEYHILGKGKSANDLKKLRREYDLSKRIIFHGVADHLKVLYYLQQCDIFLLTSITNSRGMAESQGLVTAEAQACGLPVVAFDSGGVKYTILEGETGFLCKEKDIDCYVQEVELLIKNDKLRKSMGTRAVQFIETNYSERSVRKKWKEIYGSPE